MMLSKIVKSLAAKDTVSVLQKIRNNEVELVESRDELLNEFFTHHYIRRDVGLDQNEVAIAEFDDLVSSVIQHNFLVIKKHTVAGLFSDFCESAEFCSKKGSNEKNDDAVSYAFDYPMRVCHVLINEPVAKYKITDEVLSEIEVKASPFEWVNPRVASELVASRDGSWNRSMLRDCAS